MNQYRPADSPPPYTPYGPIISRPATPTPLSNVSLQDPSDQAGTASSNSKSEEYRRSEILAVIRLAASSAIFIFGIISFSLAKLVEETMEPCYSGTSIWTSIIGLVTASAALWMVKLGDTTRKGGMYVFHFAMSMISTVAFAALSVSSSICVAHTFKFIYSGRAEALPYYKHGASGGLLALEVFVIIVGLTNMSANFASVAFTCRSWWKGDSNQAATVIYFSPQGLCGNDNGTLQAVPVPQGSQVILLPLNTTTLNGQVPLPPPLP